jgi:CBS domain-containing protein
MDPTARSMATPAVTPEDGEPLRATLSMYSPLSAIMRREPVTVPLEATVRQALETMERMRISSIVVTDPARRVPLGIFTLQDLVRRVTLPGGDLGEPIAAVMTSGLITLGPHATAHQAALTMARNGVRHVVVVDAQGKLAGIVEQEDLFGLQQLGLKEVSDRIQSARDVDGLRAAAQAIRELSDGLMARGTSAETLTHFVSTLNDLLTIRTIDLAADEHELPPVPMCWIALGSEGRLEQTFATDQDNGIIFEADEGDAEHVREALLPFARSVNAKLEACGFALCKGGIMAGNPRWCLRLPEWRRTFSRWIDEPEAEAVLHANIFFDLRPIHGNEMLSEQLRDWLLPRAADHPLFLRLMAEDAVRFEPPLGVLRDFTFDGSKEHPHTLDLKSRGSRLFVDAARVLALAHRIAPTSTAERLREVAEPANLGAEGVAALVDGFHFIHLLRLRHQRRRRPADPVGANRIDPDELNDLDRSVLKEAFRQARKLQTWLTSRFQLRT